MFWGIFIIVIVYIFINVIVGIVDGNISIVFGYVFIVMIYCYGMISFFCIMLLQVFYLVEILLIDICVKGIVFDKFVVVIVSFINFYFIFIVFKNIGWKVYMIFLVFYIVYWFMMYQVIVEIKG